ncbi:MAG: PD-(D/E)XK nuclease family protein, partial [Bacilli bacterium]|nr:PD-(D/E)XK nuclease family protein [Bacilli bacterium]
HRMVFGNTSYEEEGQTKENNNLDIITYNKEELGRISENEQEAFIIGNDIKEKIKEKYQVFDKDLKVLRNIEYKDFVILLDKSKYFDLYKKIFEYLEIPLNILKEESLKKEDDVLLLKNLLKFLIGIKEHQETIEWKKSFFSIARSYLFQLKDEELYEIMKNNTIKETDIYKTGEEIVKEMDKVPLSTFLMKVLDTYKYEEKLLTIPNTKSFRIREEYFYNLCKNYEKRGNNIYEFIEYLDQIFEEGIDLKFNIKSSSTNSVKIMTIHKSKGLEFPICYFASFSSRFNLSELKEKILFDNKYGLILPYVKEYYKDTILKTLLKKNTKKEEISEKIRLFYVALTRAKEKMIMVLREGEEEEEEISESVKENYNSFLSIMDSIYSSLYPYIKKSNVKGTKDYLYQKEKEEESKKQENTLVVEELEIKQEEIEETHYSKSSLSLPNKEEVEKMKFGTKVHEILELMDFHSYDLSKYKINNRMKEKIDAFLNSSFMKKNLDGNIEKEVEFFYEEENSISHGIIDLLIEKEEEIVIVDYKLKNIDDIEYEKQLKGYQKAVESFTKKKVKCYLYSILEEEIKEVV